MHCERASERRCLSGARDARNNRTERPEHPRPPARRYTEHATGGSKPTLKGEPCRAKKSSVTSPRLSCPGPTATARARALSLASGRRGLLGPTLTDIRDTRRDTRSTRVRARVYVPLRDAQTTWRISFSSGGGLVGCVVLSASSNRGGSPQPGSLRISQISPQVKTGWPRIMAT